SSSITSNFDRVFLFPVCALNWVTVQISGFCPIPIVDFLCSGAPARMCLRIEGPYLTDLTPCGKCRQRPAPDDQRVQAVWHRPRSTGATIRAVRNGSSKWYLVRFLRPDVASVDIRYTHTGSSAPDGRDLGPRKGLLSMALVLGVCGL